MSVSSSIEAKIDRNKGQRFVIYPIISSCQRRGRQLGDNEDQMVFKSHQSAGSQKSRTLTLAYGD